MLRGIRRPWWPPAVARHFGATPEAEAPAWLVVEDVDETAVRVLVVSWPVVDGHGSLVFGDGEPARRLSVSPSELAGADSELPRPGAVYAARLAADAEARISAPFVGRPMDLTAEMRAFVRRQARAAGDFADR